MQSSSPDTDSSLISICEQRAACDELLRRPVGQSFRKPLYHCFSSCSLNSVLFTRSSITSGLRPNTKTVLFKMPCSEPGYMEAVWAEN
ncbi:hypothetical protein EYF80_051852 [Liparis tanakae]|uniref:Uncharacterized protein n=1 Tax=Liparis tanakae TaxID=230148 RepID=A0A4Z2FB26_9TELE|nr:hypothetical protein EYF80_051852 [Liparis tanakae]